MTAGTFPSLRTTRRLLSVLAVVLLVACSDSSDPTGPGSPEARSVAAVVNSTEMSLTIFSLDDPDDRTTVGLGADGTPVGGAVRGEVAAIPLGVVPAVAIVDLAAGELLRTVSLPEGSGATGAHFVNDSIVLVANPLRGSVSPVNVRSGEVDSEIETGAYPQAFAESGGRIFVVNSELDESFQPVRDGTLTVLDAGTLEVLGQVELGARNSGGVTTGPDGRLLVMNSGSWGAADGTLSIVDPTSLQEVSLHEGFGDFPGSVAVTPDGRVFASSWSFGLVEWDLSTAAFVRGPDHAIAPGGVPSSAGVTVDPGGAVWSFFPECAEASSVLRLGADHEVAEEVPTGMCPSAMLFTVLNGGPSAR
jgi:DNA-binding beta-propeller fold protein YncE